MTQMPTVDPPQVLRELMYDPGFLSSVYRSAMTGVISTEDREVLISAPTASRVVKLLDQLSSRGIGTAIRLQLLEQLASKTVSIGTASLRPAHAQTQEVQPPGFEQASWSAMAEAIAQSPVPEAEWQPARDLFQDDERLADLLGTSTTSLQRYASRKRQTPDEIGERLHALMMIASDLSGTFNTLGVRRWFTRTRVQLGDQSPAEVLGKNWTVDSPGYGRVRTLADSDLNFQAG